MKREQDATQAFERLKRKRTKVGGLYRLNCGAVAVAKENIGALKSLYILSTPKVAFNFEYGWIPQRISSSTVHVGHTYLYRGFTWKHADAIVGGCPMNIKEEIKP